MWYDDFSKFAINNSKYIAVGANFLSAGFQYSADSAAASAKKNWQKYSNAMTNISDAMNQNVITQNEARTIQASVDQSVDIQQGSILTQAKAEVSAAAAGVDGRSVTQALTDIQANAAQRDAQRVQDLNNTLMDFNQQRAASKMQALSQQDYSYIPKPSAASALFGAATSSLKFLAGL